MSLWLYVQADVCRAPVRDGWRPLLWCLLLARNVRPILTLRLVPVLRHRGRIGCSLALPAQGLHRLFCWMAAVDLHTATRIGPGLYIIHGWSLVELPGAQIAANCTLFHGVTIGRKDDIHANGQGTSTHPVIEVEVWVGPHAAIVGGGTVGRGALIAPGSVLTKHVPVGTIVGGEPARVLAEAAVADVFNWVPLGLGPSPAIRAG